MTVYWFVWVIILILAIQIQNADYDYDRSLTKETKYHTESAGALYVICSLLLIVLAGCRYMVGADFRNYYNYENYLDLLESLKTLDEPGIRLFYVIASHIHASGQFCIFFVALITIGLQLIVIYHNTDRIGMALFLYSLLCWINCFNAVRQSIAIAVLFCGYPSLRNKDYKKYALFVILAFLCHRSAIVMILICIIAHREVNYKNLIIMIILSAAFLLSYGRLFRVVSIIMNHDLTGTEAYWSTTVNRLRPLSKIIIMMLYLYVYSNKEKTPITNFYLNILIFESVISVITMNSAALARISMYITPFSILSVVELSKGISPIYLQDNIEKMVLLFYWVFGWFECHHALFTFHDLKWFW